MSNEKFELSLLAQASSEILAWVVPAGDLFNWMCRSIVIPAGWAALGTRHEQDPILVGPQQSYDGQDTRDVLFVRSGAVRCDLSVADLRSCDGHACSGSIELDVKIIEVPAELGAFRRTIVGAYEVVRRTDLQRHLQWELHETLSELAAARSAEELLGQLDSQVVRQCVEAHLGGRFLAGGLALAGSPAARFDSPAYREFRRQQASVESRNRRVAARTQIQDALAKAQRERLSHLTEILEQLSKAAESRTDLSVGDLLRSFGESERGELYAALWHFSQPASKARLIAVVSGTEVLFFSPDDPGEVLKRVALPDTLGPLRSVSTDERSLEAGWVMVGARLGVHLLDFTSGQVADSLSASELDGESELRGGVNAVAMGDARVYATHSELGLLAWQRGMFAPPVEKLVPEVTARADTVRCARFAEGRLWFSADEKVWALPEEAGSGAAPTLYPGARERISALTVAGGVVFAGTICGQILAWDVGDPESGRVIRGPSGNPVESLAVLDNGAVDHLLIADRSNALQALVVEDSYTRRYESRNMPVRRAAVADDLFVAMNDNRDRLIAWKPSAPSGPSAVVIVPHLTGHTIQDLCIIAQA